MKKPPPKIKIDPTENLRVVFWWFDGVCTQPLERPKYFLRRYYPYQVKGSRYRRISADRPSLPSAKRPLLGVSTPDFSCVVRVL